MELFQSFRTDINTLVFPDGQAEQRVPMFRNFIVNALIQLQTYVESYKSVNVNFYNKIDSFDDCGVSVLPGPRGEVGAVYAFRPNCHCERYFYEPVSLEKMSCLYEKCRCSTVTCSPCSTTGITYNPYCGYNINGDAGCQPPYLASLPEDDTNFKLADRYYAIGPAHKLWLYPRFPCGYVVAVHWKGIRRSYLDTDYVYDDSDLKDTVAAYVESEVASRIDNDAQRASRLFQEYRLKASDIIYREENDLKPKAARLCAAGLDTSTLLQIYPDNTYPANVGGLPPGFGTTVPIGEPIYVNLVPDLRLITDFTHTVVICLGYYTPGDNGGGIYWFNPSDTTADDGGSVIKPNVISGAGRFNKLLP